MTTEIAVELVDSTDRFGTIAVFHNGDDDSQWFLGQWNRYIVLMNGDDYSYERRWPRIAADTSKVATNRFLITITSDQKGSTFYLNGEVFAKRKPNFIQTLPVGGRLVLGNSADGRRPWSGTISSLAFYKVAVSPKFIRDRFAQWNQSGEVSLRASEEPWLLYPFDEGEGTRVLDHSRHEIHLEIPKDTTILKKVFLSRDLHLPLAEQLTTWDAGLNLFGFFFFGLLLASLLAMRLISQQGLLVLAVTTAGFGLSIGIEFIQVWMPARSSTILDLVLNTVGALGGALFYCLLLSGRTFPDAAGIAPDTDNRTKSDSQSGE
jgi:VanZ family protein